MERQILCSSKDSYLRKMSQLNSWFKITFLVEMKFLKNQIALDSHKTEEVQENSNVAYLAQDSKILKYSNILKAHNLSILISVRWDHINFKLFWK